MRTGFIHIPFLPEQVVDKRNMPSMPLEMIAKDWNMQSKLSLKIKKI